MTTHDTVSADTPSLPGVRDVVERHYAQLVATVAATYADRQTAEGAAPSRARPASLPRAPSADVESSAPPLPR